MRRISADSVRQFAHDVNSLTAGIKLALQEIDRHVTEGKPVPPDLARSARGAAEFLDDVFSDFRANRDVAEAIDLWVICAHYALSRSRVELHRQDQRLIVHGSRNDAARLIGVLLDNALRYGHSATINGSAGKIVVVNDVVPFPTTVARAHAGTGLPTATSLAERLGLTLVTHNDAQTFTVTLAVRTT